MSNIIKINNTINKFKQTILVPGDKSLYQMGPFASLANGKSKQNLLMSEDVLAAIEAVKKLGIKVIIKKECNFGKGLTDIDLEKI